MFKTLSKAARIFYFSLIALLGLCGAVALGNYTMTQGVGTNFGSIIVGGVQYAQQLFCDPTTVGQCAAVSSGGAVKVDNSAVIQPISAASLPLPTGAATNSALTTINTTLGSPMQTTGGTVTANAGTNLNTSALALESGGNLAQLVTDIGPPGATACAGDTSSCNTNQQMQRLAQRLTSIVTALGSPFQAGGSIANTSFGATQSGTWTVQPGNTANTTPWLVTAGQGGTWNITNISGTVSLPTGASTSAKQPALGIAGSASSDVLTVQGIAAMTPLLVTLSGTNNINNISGTISLPTGASTSANQTGGNQKTQIVDGSGNVIASTSNNLNVQCANCSGSGASAADEASFTAGTSVLAPGGGFFQTTATNNALTTGQQGMVQMTANRAFFMNLRNASGTEIGTNGNPLRIDPVGTTTQPVSGTVTVNQSTASSLNATVVQGTSSNLKAQVDPLTSASWGLGAFAAAMPTNGMGIGLYDGTNIVRAKGDETSGLWVNIKAGAGSGGTALADQAVFTQGTTSITPVGCLTITSYTGLTSGHAGVLSCTTAGSLHTTVDNSNANGSATSANSSPVVIASDQAAITVKGPVASGVAVSGNPVLVAGQDGTNARTLLTDSSGRSVVVGAGTAGSATGGILTVQGVASMTKLLVTPDSVALPANQSVNVSQINAVTPLMGNGVTGTGSQRVTIASDNTAFSVNATLQASASTAIGKVDPNTSASWGLGATGSAPPANAQYIGANASGATGGQMRGLINCDNHIFKHITTATDTLAVQGVASQTIFICGWRSRAAGTATWFLENTASANANCSSTLTQITGVASEIANSGDVTYNPIWGGLKNTSGNGLCINSTGTGGVDIDVWYTQF